MSNKKQQDPKKKRSKKKKVSYYKQPEELTLRQWQLALRQQYGRDQQFTLTNEGDHPVWSDFTVANPEQRTAYRVALRGKEPGDNFCECYDFRTNTLGTCKHIEWALYKLYNTYGNKQHFKKPPPERAYSSVYLEYGRERSVRLRLGTDHREALSQLAEDYFEEEGVLRADRYLQFDDFLEQAQAIAPSFRCYPDALDFIIQERADERRAEMANELRRRADSLKGLLHTDLFPYQREGVLFAFEKGRCLLADEMGLGKTIQAIAAAELYRRELGIGSVMIICPTSLKYQWRAEIRRFTNSEVHVVEGLPHQRRKQYLDESHFYKIITYNVAARDWSHINESLPDLIILDEAQRIKNWHTQIAQAVKRLESPYRIAMTGTPLENKLEDIYSIVQFLDQYLLGPLFLLLARHQARDEQGAVRGYRHLDEVHEKLNQIMIRRRKRDVEQQLPPRMDQRLLVPMTEEQQDLHAEFESSVAKLVAKWKRQGFLLEKDRRRLLSALNLMRMSCNSTYLIDQQTRHDTKIDELFYILSERLVDETAKVVIFSQWERMTRLVAQELEEQEIPYAYLHGGVPGAKRGELLDRFREDDQCRVFLSTDAGGVGLNLQRAALVINLDLPWNPAVLEQRIARVHRMGQKRPVQVINLIAESTIEHRMVMTLQFKSSLAEAVLDTAEANVFMSDRKFRDFMENLEKMQPAEQQTDDAPAPGSTSYEEDLEVTQAPSAPDAETTDAQEQPASVPEEQPDTLLADGLNFLGRLARTLQDEQATRQLVDQLVEKDTQTGQTYLKIPVENQGVVQDAMKLLGRLLGK